MARLTDSHDYLFTLRVQLRKDAPMIVIHAWDGGVQHPYGHNRLDVELRMGGKVIFPRGVTWCAVNSYTSIDGIDAKELVMSLFAMKPGDTDSEYFEKYSPEQLEFAETYGEDIDYVKHDRYCDPESGEVRS